MTRWLVTVEAPDKEIGQASPIAGIYVDAETSEEAIALTRAYLKGAKLVAWNKGKVAS